MAQVVLKDFNGGMWPSMPPDKLEDGKLRRVRAVDNIKTGSSRGRNGSQLVTTVSGVHSLHRYNDSRFYATDHKLYRDEVEIDDGYDSTRLAFAAMPTTVNESIDYLFVAGGGKAVKVSPAGVASKWGIAAPTSSFTAAKQDKSELVIDTLDATTGWTANNASLLANTTIFQAGTGSLAATVTDDIVATFWKNITLDLTEYAGAVVSPEEDYISFWVLTTDADAIDFMQIDFALGASWVLLDSVGSCDDIYSYQFVPGDVNASITGAAAIIDESILKKDNKSRAGDARSDPANSETIREILRLSQQIRLSSSPHVWTQLRIPKLLFKREGTTLKGVDLPPLDWADVEGVRFTVRTNTSNSVKVYIDDLQMGGGVGLQGDYRYRCGFFNTETGSYSNPNSADVTVTQVDRQGVLLSGLPTTCPDPQVDQLVIWRTMGDGATFFVVTKFDIGPATYIDTVADYFGLNSDNDAVYLESEEMELDNDPPPDTIDHCIGPFQGRMWWLDDADTGRVYYSAAGRPEAMEGNVNITEKDDPLQRLTMWAGRIYALSEKHVFEVGGSSEPFTYREFEGVPGTIKPYTLAASPNMIIYEARAGIMAFDGTASRLLSPEAVLPLFHGQTRSGMQPFSGEVAIVWHNAYYISDNVRTLVVDIDEKNSLLTGREDGAWYEFGLAFNAFDAEMDTDELLGATDTKILSLEFEGLYTDDGEAIPYMIETLAIPVGIGRRGMLQRIYIDAAIPADVELKPTLILDDWQEIVLPVATQLQRGIPVEYSQLRVARLIALRLECNYTLPIEVFEIGFEVHAWPNADKAAAA